MATPLLTCASSLLKCATTTTMSFPSFSHPSVLQFTRRSHITTLSSVSLKDRMRVIVASGDSDSVHTSDHHQVAEVAPEERDFSGTPHVPVYVMLPLGIINMECELVDSDDLENQLRMLKSIDVDGVMVDTWWGIVEANNPQQYNWKGYRKLFEIVRELDLKLQRTLVVINVTCHQVVMSFHECGGNVGDDVHIPLPKWIIELGKENPDIYFTDRDGRRNPESLTWGIDKERVLRGRTAVEVYFEYMRSFRVEFDEFFEDGSITEIEIGLGACGELRYPSYPAKHGWKYPGIGEFQFSLLGFFKGTYFWPRPSG
ncbi:beta-amylase 2 [Artemisia annua]|uniref:Beta-amylase n=1 Tax=Artemisia annua TaxID=35608 RepID=A0A2U1NHM5_ARTAN|nr:beta-amylase 2 [Artemisia annua]